MAALLLEKAPTTLCNSQVPAVRDRDRGGRGAVQLRGGHERQAHAEVAAGGGTAFHDDMERVVVGVFVSDWMERSHTDRRNLEARCTRPRAIQ